MPEPSDHIRNCNRVFIALGGNLGGQMDSPVAYLHFAIDKIIQSGAELVRKSRLYRTPAFPPGSGPDFVNAALACDTKLSPRALLAVLHDIEAEAGRLRTERWGPRVLDIDLLAMGDVVMPNLEAYQSWHDLPLDAQMTQSPTELILPHPRLQERGFVLVPLMDVAPDWCHPVLGLTVAEMLARLPASERSEIVPISQEIHPS